MATPEEVQHLTKLGFTVFPCTQDKRPRVRWQDDPPTEAGWPFRTDDLIGVRLPEGTVVLDIDNQPLFRESGLDPTYSVVSGTRRDDGMHVFYRTDRPADQVAAGRTLGYDTRVGGKGYVIAWDASVWRPVDEWAMAPDWMYLAPNRTNDARDDEDPDAVMVSDDDVIRWLGRLVNASTVKYNETDLIALQVAALADGRIAALDPSEPWTMDDWKRHARQAAKWQPAQRGEYVRDTGPDLGFEPEGLEEMSASDLLNLDLPPLNWLIPTLLPEGMGIIAAPPKSGKSVFAYQVAMELSLDGKVFDLPVTPGPVLYYALEDGKRRSQARVRDMLRGRTLPNSFILRWTSPRLGGDLEREVHAWLQVNRGGLVIIDVLAKVRPKAGGKSKNAYDEDYDALSLLQSVARENPGSCILVVTHDRKAGSDDWMTRVTGTRGVTGAADFVMFINRDRGKATGTIVVSGRDVEDNTFPVTFDVTGWKPIPAGEYVRDQMEPARLAIYDWLAENGPAFQQAICDGTFLSYATVNGQLQRGKSQDVFTEGPEGYDIPRAATA